MTAAPSGRAGDAGPLSVLHVDPERGLGGGERQVLGLLDRLHARGIQQRLVADPDGRLAALAVARGVPVTPLRIRNHLDLVAGRRLAGLLAREAYDIVHFHTARAHAMAAFLGASSAARVVTRRMDYALRGGWYTRRLYNREVQAVVAISEGVRSALVASGVDPTRIHLIPSGVDADAFRRTRAERDTARRHYGLGADVSALVMVGALEDRKGHAVALAALARCRDPQLRLLCAGEGSRGAALAEQVRVSGLEGVVRFLGRIDDVAGLLAAADVMLMPSWQEGLGVAALEAMAAGLPVIASRVGGLAEAVDDETGVLIAPGDTAALAAAITRLTADPALAERLGAAGAARVRARYTTVAMADATLALYRRLADAPRAETFHG